MRAMSVPPTVGAVDNLEEVMLVEFVEYAIGMAMLLAPVVLATGAVAVYRTMQGRR